MMMLPVNFLQKLTFLKQVFTLSLAKYIKKKIELYENLVGTGFLEPP